MDLRPVQLHRDAHLTFSIYALAGATAEKTDSVAPLTRRHCGISDQTIVQTLEQGCPADPYDDCQSIIVAIAGHAEATGEPVFKPQTQPFSPVGGDFGGRLRSVVPLAQRVVCRGPNLVDDAWQLSYPAIATSAKSQVIGFTVSVIAITLRRCL